MVFMVLRILERGVGLWIPLFTCLDIRVAILVEGVPSFDIVNEISYCKICGSIFTINGWMAWKRITMKNGIISGLTPIRFTRRGMHSLRSKTPKRRWIRRPNLPASANGPTHSDEYTH